MNRPHFPKLLFLAFHMLLLSPFNASGQQRASYQLSVEVIDKEDASPIDAAYVLLTAGENNAIKEASCVTLPNGRCTIDFLNDGEYALLIQHVAYESHQSFLRVTSDTVLKVGLRQAHQELEEAIVVGDAIGRPEDLNHTLERKDMELLHGGIEDPLEAIAALPGVVRTGGRFSSSYPSFRGGNPSEVRYLLDNARFISPLRFGRSAFSTDLMEKVEVFNGPYPASYGQALSGISNFVVKDGHFRRWKNDYFSYDISTAKSRFDGPILKDKLSFITSLRSTYLNHAFDALGIGELDFVLPNFKDALSKFTWKVNNQNKLSLTNFVSWGKWIDFSEEEDDSSGQLRNTQNLQWQSNLTNRWYSKFVLAYSQISFNNQNFSRSTFTLREEASYFLSSNDLFKTGFGVNIDRIELDDTLSVSIVQLPPDDVQDEYLYRAYDFSHRTMNWFAFALYDGAVTPELTTNAGLRLEADQAQILLSPRGSLNWQVHRRTMLKVASGLYTRFAAPLSHYYNRSAKPEKAIHYLLGVEQQLVANKWSASANVFSKQYQNLLLETTPYIWENVGSGSVNGLELGLRKRTGKLRGFFNYSWMQSERTIGHDLLPHPSFYDYTHSLKIVPRYTFQKAEGKRLTIQLNYRFVSGRPYTEVQEAIETSDDRYYAVIGEINALRFPDRQRLGCRIQLQKPLKNGGLLQSYLEFTDILFRRTVIGRSLSYGDEYENNFSETFVRTTPLDFIPAGGFKIVF